MKLYNKGGRALILPVGEVIDGGRFLANEPKKDRKYFDPETDITVKDEYGEKLLGMYPSMLKQLDESPKNTVTKMTKKTTKKTSKKR